MNFRLASVLLLLAAAAAGCSEDPAKSTQIVVVVDSDMAVPGALDRVTIDVSGLKKAPAPASADLAKQDLPRSLGLFHTGGPLGPIRVRARGFLDSAQVVERLAIVSFEQDKTLELRVPLSASCAAADLACSADMTCDRGHCVTATQDDLPLFKGTVKGFDVDDVEPPGGDAGSADGGPVDAGGMTTNEKPQCTISAPQDGATFAEGENVSFSGSCQDPESGPIRVGLSWESNAGGMLGTGARLSVSTLAAGTHMISLCAPDPEQATLRGCATISITVSAANKTSATISALMQGNNASSPFTTAAPLTATGSGTGEDPLKFAWTDSLLGPIGEGMSVTLDPPPKGKHTLTLAVTDSRAQTATDNRSFVVRDPGKSLLETVPSATMRFDALASASDDRVYAAGPARRAVYLYDGSSTPTTALTESDLPDLVHDISLDEQLGYAYIGTKGFLICPFSASGGIAASSCNQFKGGAFGNDECNAMLRVTGSNGMQYLLIGTTRGLIVTSPDAVPGSIVSVRRLTTVDIRAIARVDGTAWLATAQGLYSFDPVTNASQRYGAATGAPSDTLTSIRAASDGVLWVGSSNGLGRYVPSSHTWTVWRAGDAPAPGLVSNDVRDLVVARSKIGSDTRDIVWVATAAGVSRLDPTLPSFTSFTQEDGLPSNSVRTITLIRGDTKVFATDSGAVTYDGI
jgi:hypothetical protein